MSLSKKCNVPYSLVTNNSPMNRIPKSNSLTSPIFLCYIYPSLLNLARLHTEKFLVLPTKSWDDTNTCHNFLKSLYSLDDKIRTTVQLITYTVLQNYLSLFTMHQKSQFRSKFFSICPIKLRG